MSSSSPGSVRIRSATLQGNDITNQIHDLRIWTSIFKPFRVAEVILTDSINLINRLKLKGNEDFEISFDTAGNGSENVYRAKMKTTKPGNITDFPSAKAQAYRIKLADEIYFKNQTTKLTKAFSDITGTDIIKKIFDEHLSNGSNKLNIIKPSKGMIGTNKQKFIRANEYPLASISSVLKYLYANESGNYVFFQDDKGDFHCGPLAEIINQGKNGGSIEFTRNPTIGKDSTDADGMAKNIYGLYIPEKSEPANIYRNMKNVIPDSKTPIGEEYHKGQKKEKIQTDKVIGKPIEADNYQHQDNIRNVLNTVTDKKLFKNHNHENTMGSRQLYASLLEHGPSYSMTVFGDYGIDVHVGKGIKADIPAPSGDQNAGSQNDLKGPGIVANSMKHLKPYDVSPQFECTFDIFRGGLENQ